MNPKRSNFSFKRRLPGFSLLELLVVMTVMSVLILLIAPSIFSVLHAQALSSGAREVSNHLVKARSLAIAKHTLTRLLFAKTWPEEKDSDDIGSFRKYSIWEWNPENSKFERVSEWRTLPPGTFFEPAVPGYIKKSNYAINDATSVYGDDGFDQKDAEIKVKAYNDAEIEAQFVEFLPTGAARLPGGTQKKVIYVLAEGEINTTPEGPMVIRKDRSNSQPKNWAQVNLDTLTGRVRIYRPR